MKGDRIEYVFKIVPVWSNFGKEQIFPIGEPIRAMVPLRIEDRSFTGNLVCQ